MLDLINMPFLKNALLGGLIVITTLSLLSFFVVLKRISFIGVGISHSALGGVAIALASGLDVTFVTLIFCTIMAVLIGIISTSTRIREDSAIGIIFSTTMALGVAITSISGVYSSRLFGYLFGTILGITQQDIKTALLILVITGTLLAGFFKPLLYSSFSEDVARVRGVPVRLLYFLLLIMISLATVAAIKLVGIILTSAMLVLPASTGYQISGRYSTILAASLAFGVISLVLGLIASYQLDLPSGPSIVIIASLIFAIASALARLWKTRPSQ